MNFNTFNLPDFFIHGKKIDGNQSPADHAFIISDSCINLIIKSGQKIYLIEEQHDQTASFSLTITLEENAHIEHVRLICNHADLSHQETRIVNLAKGSEYRAHQFILEGNQEINETVYLKGADASYQINGLMIGKGEQKNKINLTIEHTVPHTNSTQNFRLLLDDHSSGFLNGTVIVNEGAFKSKANQQIKSLLLSPNATVSPEPMLKIFNDDVQCTHGATVGQLDKNALFYLKSRGLSEQTAKHLLLTAFAEEIVAGVSNEKLREEIKHKIETLL